MSDRRVEILRKNYMARKLAQQSVLFKAGIDTSVFKAHSIRGATTSAAAEAGMSIPETLEAADWSSQ